MENAQKCYTRQSYEECLGYCDEVLIKFVDFDEAVKLKQSAMKQLELVPNVNEAINNLREHFENNRFRECMNEYNLILSTIRSLEIESDEYETEISDIIEKVKAHIKDILIKANQCFKNKKFDECVEHCNYVLNIQESLEAKNLANDAKSEEIIISKWPHVKKFYESKRFKRCINECKKLLKLIKPFDEIRKVIENCEIAIDEENQSKKMISSIMSEAQQNYKKTYYSDCIKDCVKKF